MDVLSQVAQDIRTRQLIPHGARLLLAVSGGLDSMVLLHLVHALSIEHKWTLSVAHFNHHLRGAGSDADEALVRRVAQAQNLAVIAGSGDVRGKAESEGTSIEMAARELRHQFLARTATVQKAGIVALAHHAEDQVELFFLRLLRGAGSGGLSGMKWQNRSPADAGVTLVRPLLNQTKASLLEYAGSHALEFNEDESNQSEHILRNRVRHSLLPLLRETFQPSLTSVILRQMELLRAEDDCLDEWTRAQAISRDAVPFALWPVALQRRHLQSQLKEHRLTADFERVESLRLDAGRKVMVSPGITVRRDESGSIEVIPARDMAFSAASRAAQLSGDAGQIVFDGRTFEWARQSGHQRARKCKDTEWFDADRVGNDVVLRFWREGDRFQPIGMTVPVKLQDLFTNLKIPAPDRRRRVVACTSGGEIWWVEGMRIGESFKVRNDTIHQLQWRWG